MALDLLQQLQAGNTNFQQIPLAWYISTQSGKYDPPQAVADQGILGGLKKLTQAEATARFKEIVPLDLPKYESWQQSYLTDIQNKFPGIQQGENVYDWMMRVQDVGVKSGLQLAKQFLINPETKDPENYKLGETFVNANTAAKLMNMTPAQLQTQIASDVALKEKIKTETEAETARQAEIQQAENTGQPIPIELLAPGIGAGTGAAGIQTGSADLGIISQQTGQASGRPATKITEI